MNRIHIENSAGLITHKFDTMKEAEDFMAYQIERHNPYGCKIVTPDNITKHIVDYYKKSFEVAINELVCEKGPYSEDALETMFYKGIKTALNLQESRKDSM